MTKQLEQNDWICSCVYTNFRRNTHCKGCQAPKNALITTNSCKVCMDGALEASLPCGHVCMCLICAIALPEFKCPICRDPYKEEDVKRVYL
jgi:hypothetical protein